MSDAGEVGGKKVEQYKQITRHSSDDFGRAVARIAVAQVCESVGFEAFSESALESLADIAVRCIGDLGKSSKFYASLAGRTECNVFDVVRGLEDLSLSRGFYCASKIHSCSVVSSGAISELKEYVETAEEIPFVKPLPKFPVSRAPKQIPSFLLMGEPKIPKHIPAWLPAFPDPHTYVRTPVWNERVSDPRADKIELARQHRKAERSLLNLQQRLLSNGLQERAAGAASSVPDDERNSFESDKLKHPFLAEPFQPGEKEVSVITLPTKLSDKKHYDKQATLLHTFAPAIEAMKHGLDSGSDGEKSAPPSKRAPISLKFRSWEKMFGEPLDSRIRPGKTEPWFGQKDEKDDKKRRAEFILRQCRQNQHELPQL